MKIRGKIDGCLIAEYLFSVVIIGAVIYSFWYLYSFGYFPQPFFYDVGDTWMDWFNPAYWSHEPGAYDSYKTIYPPLTFVILHFITDGSCYAGAQGGWARNCDIVGIIALHTVYVACIVVTALTLYRVDRRTALPRSIAISLGLPMLWGLDRGNFVLVAYICVVLAFGPLVRSAKLRWIFAGMAVNLKVYLIGALLAQLLHRRWRWTEGALLSTVIIYLLSLAAFGSGLPWEIYRNITDYSEGLTINNPLDIWMASSLQPLLALSKSEVFPAVLFIGSRNVHLIETAIPIIVISAQATIVLAAAACFVRPETIPRHRMVALSIGIALLSSEVSAYTQIMVLIFVFMERADGWLRRYAIFTSYLAVIPLDYNIDRLPPFVKETFWQQRPVIVELVVQIGPFIRPLLTMSIPVALALLTIITVYKDIRLQGWSNRWRFRHDAPMLPWVRRPSSPS